MNERELLVKVRARLATPGVWAQGGWAQGGSLYRDWNGACDCLYTAIEGTTSAAYDTRRFARQLLYKMLPKPSADHLTPSIMNWNDAPERTLDEVLALIDAAIAAYDSSEVNRFA